MHGDVLTQISAATRALQAVSLGLFDEHLKHCVTSAITEGGAAARFPHHDRASRPTGRPMIGRLDQHD